MQHQIRNRAERLIARAAGNQAALEDTIRGLSAELAVFDNDLVEPYFHMLDGKLPVEIGLVWVDGNEQGPGFFEVCECWHNGNDILLYLDSVYLKELDEVARKAAQVRNARERRDVRRQIGMNA